MQPQQRLNIITGLLIFGAILVLIAIYYSPIWWVSLTAPNYPKESFPDGVRIDFHMNGVFNGCKKVEKTEIREEEALDCVHEMDTINHYVGMYPIAAGGPIERAFSPFLMTFLGVLIIGFAIPSAKPRVLVMSLGLGVILVWMSMTLYTKDGLKYQNSGYLSALITALDQDKSEETEQPRFSSGQAIIERLRRSLGESSAKTEPKDEQKGDKARTIDSLRVNFEKDRERKGKPEAWAGSGFQTMAWHYEKTLGRYFNNPAEIEPLVQTLKVATHVVFVALIGAMALVLWGARKKGGILYWLMIIAPLLLPVFFIFDYAVWLWWFGHNLNEMGAFTVKPFMPTVFGDGKVAQFTTHSYPYWGFGLMLVFSALLAIAALIRRKQLQKP